MAKCLNCDNKTNFNVWCTVSKILEVEFDNNEKIKNIMGEPEEEELQDQEEYWVLNDDLEFAIISCAWCNSKNVQVDHPISDIINNNS